MPKNFAYKGDFQKYSSSDKKMLRILSFFSVFFLRAFGALHSEKNFSSDNVSTEEKLRITKSDQRSTVSMTGKKTLSRNHFQKTTGKVPIKDAMVTLSETQFHSIYQETTIHLGI